MKALIYTRSSALNGDSLEAQESVCLAWAKQQGYSVVETLSDNGTSGTKEANDRPGLSVALAALEEGQAEAIIVHRLDRLARALHVQEVILGRVWNVPARVFACDGGEVIQDDPTDPMRTFCRQVLGAAAQLERGMIIARMQAGKRRQRAAGFYSGGRVPFGYRLLEDGQLEQVEDELETACEIAAMRSEGLTLRAIADDLNRSGIPAPNGGLWFAQTVSRACQRAEAL
jgi:DNA invertase Pin-like site-specific DNA recombinase